MPTPSAEPATRPSATDPLPHGIIDLRSDTVTRPGQAMRQAMAAAEVGDDVLGDDPTVIRLQKRVAEIMGKEAACFVPSGTMANQTAIRAHTEPGDELIAHRDSHIIHYETGSPAALSGVMINPVDGPRGVFDADQVLARPYASHFSRTRLVVIENTHNRGGGAIWPLEQIKAVAGRAREQGLRLHLDGARIWNACAATGIEPAQYAQKFDTVSCCFSKGLGAPVGSAVAGDEETIFRIHRFRKMFGGSMRQAGIVAAAALYALEHHRQRLIDDHKNARQLADRISSIPGLALALPVETNMVFFDLDPVRLDFDATSLCEQLRSRNVWMLPVGPRRVRAVCHLDITPPMIESAAGVLEQICRS